MSPETLPLFSFILFLGIVTSLEDVRARKIKNKWILLSVGFVLLFYAATFLTDEKITFAMKRDIVRDVSVNGVLALCAGFILWKACIWPPGDAKLFFAYALLVPLPFYANGYLPYFPSLALLINIFLAGFVYITLATLRSQLNLRVLALWIENDIFKQKARDAVSAEKLANVSRSLARKFLGAVSMIILVTSIREMAFTVFLARYAVLLTAAFLFAYAAIQKFLLKTFRLWQIALFVFAYVVLGFVAGSGGAFLQHFFVVLKISLLFMFVGEVAGMLLKPYIDFLGKEETKQEKASLVSRNALSDYVASESGSNVSSIAFAPLMFCGVLTTLVMKQSILHYLLQLLRNR